MITPDPAEELLRSRGWTPNRDVYATSARVWIRGIWEVSLRDSEFSTTELCDWVTLKTDIASLTKFIDFVEAQL